MEPGTFAIVVTIIVISIFIGDLIFLAKRKPEHKIRTNVKHKRKEGKD